MKKAMAVVLGAAFLLSAVVSSGLSVFGQENDMAPLAWYSFDNVENLGEDVTGNANHLTGFGTPAQEADGKSGGAVRFDGSSSLYAAPDGEGLDFVDKIDASKGGSGKITIAFWLKTKASDFVSADWRRVVDNGQNAGLGYGGFTMLSLVDSLESPTMYNPVVGLNTAAEAYANYGNWSTYAFTEDWHYITWSLDTATSQSIFYVNATPIFDSGAMWADLDFLLCNSNALFSLGAQTISQSFDDNMRLINPFLGMIDELAVFDTILTPEDISYYMTRGYESSSDGYSVYLSPELGCSAEYIIDGNTVIITATPSNGYAIKTMYYQTDGGDVQQITGGAFEMPGDNVTVHITTESLTVLDLATQFDILSNVSQYHSGKVLLIGEDTMALWNTSDADLAPENTVNLGIPSTSINWHLANLDVYERFNPSAVVIYSGANDMNGNGMQSKTGADTAVLAVSLITEIRSVLDVPVYYVSILPSRSEARWSVWNDIQTANSAIKSFCDSTDKVTYIDIAGALQNEGTDNGGKPLAALYAEDGISLSGQGYDVWATTIRDAFGIEGDLPQNPPVNEPLDRTPDAMANLLGYYEFEDISNPGKDSSYNGNHLKFYTQVFEDGENWWEPNNEGFVQTDGADGQGKAASFDGYSFFVYETPEGEADFTDEAKSLTVNYYVKNRRLVYEEEAYTNGWMVAVNNGGNYPEKFGGWSFNCAYNNAGTSNNFPMWIENGTTPVYNTINAGTDSADEWNRVTFVLDSENKKAFSYLNGELIGTTNISGDFTLSNRLFDFSIGAFVVGDPGEYSTYVANAPFVGYLDSVMVFDGALTAKQVADLDVISLEPLKVTSTLGDVMVGDNKLTYKGSIKTYSKLFDALVLPANAVVKLFGADGSEITDLNTAIKEGSVISLYNDRNILLGSYILAEYEEEAPSTGDMAKTVLSVSFLSALALAGVICFRRKMRI